MCLRGLFIDFNNRRRRFLFIYLFFFFFFFSLLFFSKLLLFLNIGVPTASLAFFSVNCQNSTWYFFFILLLFLFQIIILYYLFLFLFFEGRKFPSPSQMVSLLPFLLIMVNNLQKVNVVKIKLFVFQDNLYRR